MEPTWGRWYWPVWAVLAFGTFIVPEVAGLVSNWQNTLSAAVWRMENFQTGQSVINWSVVHFMFIAVLLVLDVWLLGHFGWGLWTS